MITSAIFEYRMMKPEEAPLIFDLFSRVITPLVFYNARAKSEELAKYSVNELEGLIAHDKDSIILALDNARPVGFCISKYDDGLILLSWFGIDWEYRGLGIGQGLLEVLFSTLPNRNAHKIWCDTRTSNHSSQKLLISLGFKRTAHFKNHWYGQDFFIWEWTPSDYEQTNG